MSVRDILRNELDEKKEYFSEEAYNVLVTEIVSEFDNAIISNRQDKIECNDIKSIDAKRAEVLTQNSISDILISLKKFEESKGFLKSNINLIGIAHKLSTNSKYLSKTINLHKKKSFTKYITDLRIEYLLNRLQSDSKYRNYTIKAIAQEIGFNTPNTFSRAFYKKMGMYPSEYIKTLD
ncbi:helix-turn-helix domain-containing protein [Aquimarina pacifica]|uniref:helix-turn-helix domain-containing protein n=1 Tax=Aquimarina pacifica TaxID=1296415 RepID=UPI00046FA566|nr:helix-turn-helix domain-containing protein [Aquimarina pacifica]